VAGVGQGFRVSRFQSFKVIEFQCLKFETFEVGFLAALWNVGHSSSFEIIKARNFETLKLLNFETMKR
jgi:hypothetical protein